MNESKRGDVPRTLAQLRKGNARLKALLMSHGIRWEEEQNTSACDEVQPSPTHESGQVLDTAAKVALFRRLFRGRADAYPVRWQSASGKSGYSPACDNE